MVSAGRLPDDDLRRILDLVTQALQVADDADEYLIGAVLSDVKSRVEWQIDRRGGDRDARYGDPFLR